MFLRGEPGDRRVRRRLSVDQRIYLSVANQIYSVGVLSEDVAVAAYHDVLDYVLVTEAFLLKLNANGKELDPRHFSVVEAQAFDESDAKERKAWIDNKVVEQLDEQARPIPRQGIFRVPARVVRTNKAAAGLKQLVAKSRIVLPGHLDPDGGLVRTDAPTTVFRPDGHHAGNLKGVEVPLVRRGHGFPEWSGGGQGLVCETLPFGKS